jgi:hypothetical protein
MGEIVSQAKFFVDYGASGTVGSAAAIAGNSRALTKVKNADVKSDADIEVQTAVGVSQGAGFRHKEGGGEITLTVMRETGPTPEVHWRRLWANRTTFTFTIQDELGGIRQSFTCRVAKPDGKSDDQGVHEDTVTLKYTKMYFS